jgi:hypothetical protein
MRFISSLRMASLVRSYSFVVSGDPGSRSRARGRLHRQRPHCDHVAPGVGQRPDSLVSAPVNLRRLNRYAVVRPRMRARLSGDPSCWVLNHQSNGKASTPKLTVNKR